jgi:IS605 OrfB family transposase
MQQTYQDRLSLDAEQLRWLGACGELYGRLQRTLYARIAKGDNASQIKPQFCAEHGLSARQFNAMRLELEGKISGTAELLKLRKKELKGDVQSTTRSIARLKKDIAGQIKLHSSAQARGFVFSLKQHDTLCKRLFGKKRRLERLQSKARDVDERLNAPVPGICFGSRKLFNQQFHLHQSDFGEGENGQAAWRRAWRDSRSHQFFVVGSKDETAGNQSCKARLVHAAPTTGLAPTLTVLLKMPPALVAQGAPIFLTIDGIRFEHGQRQVESALASGTALSYRFHRDNHSASGWRVFVSTDTKDEKIATLPKEMGVIGVDFNADHLAASKTDRFGNLVAFWRFELPLKGKTSGQRTAILSEALDQVFAVAKSHACPVALEDLDFSAKKKEMRSLGDRYARMLSGLAYAAFRQLAMAKASRLGIELQFVNPAYTSVAGSVNYAVRLGRAVHQAASGVIARRAQGYSEKLPKSGPEGCTFRAPLMGHAAVLTLPARNRDESTRAAWGKIRRSLTQHCAEQARLRKKSSSHPGAAGVRVNMRSLDGAQAPSRESGILLARRNTSDPLPDVQF